MPIHFRDNQYHGVNAHLHSLLQREGGGWESFHGAYIGHLTEAIDAKLPEGYYVLNEKSLQIGAIDPLTGDLTRSRSRPDVAIYETSPEETGHAAVATLPSPTLVVPTIETLLEEDYLRGLIVYQQTTVGFVPIIRIELLSPANKPGGSYFDVYMEKRREALQTLSRLIEIDYLHESRSHIPILPSYPHKETGAYPYLVAVNDPRPSLDKGSTAIYGFTVDMPIPSIEITLAGSDSITIDFNAVYNRTFASNRYYNTILVDYEQLPVNFESYSEADQQRIRERMKTVQEKAEQQSASQQSKTNQQY